MKAVLLGQWVVIGCEFSLEMGLGLEICGLRIAYTLAVDNGVGFRGKMLTFYDT